MNDSELESVFRDLSKVLEEAGLGWIVEAVESEIAFGRSVIKQVRTYREASEQDGRAVWVESKGAGSQFLTTQAYSPRDQLGLLVDALERAVCDTADMEEETAAVLRDSLSPITAIQFVSTPAREPPHVVEDHEGHSIVLSTIKPRLEKARELRKLLAEIREAMNTNAT